MGNYNVPPHDSGWCYCGLGIVLTPGVAGRGQTRRQDGPDDCAEMIEKKDREGRRW